MSRAHNPYDGVPARVLIATVRDAAVAAGFGSLDGRARAEALVRLRVREAGRIHGSEVQDILVGCAAGRFSVDSYDAERLIERLGLEPERADKPDPTVSQRVFTGLQFRKHPGYVAGCRCHFWLRLPQK